MGANDKLEATFHGAEEARAAIIDAEPVDRDPQADAELARHQVTERETVGDWASHTPGSGLQQLWEKQDAAAFDAEMHRANINDGIRSLVTISGENSRDHGFHEDFPALIEPKEVGESQGSYDSRNGAAKAQLGLAVTQKLMLMAEELLESFGEIRSGRAMDEVYFVDKKGLIGPKGAEYPAQRYGQPDGSSGYGGLEAPREPGDIPLLKPEGFIVEIADLLIRAADLTYLLNLRGKLVHALEIKHEYNATRPFKHGRQF